MSRRSSGGRRGKGWKVRRGPAIFYLAEGESAASGSSFDAPHAKVPVDDSISFEGKMKDNCNVKVVTDVMYSFRVSKVF